MPACEVINLKNGDDAALARQQRRLVRVGRPSIWSNPFSHLPDAKHVKYQVRTREEALDKYEAWLQTQPGLIERAKRELRGKVLGCWCVPDRCHAQILAKIVNDAHPEDAAVPLPPLPPTPEDLRAEASRNSPTTRVFQVPTAVVASAVLGVYDPESYGARCGECPLKGRHTPVGPSYAAAGPGATKLIVIGEGPGRMEIQTSKPFCFVPETRVLMSDLTWRSLGNIRVGDTVLTLSEHPVGSSGVSGYAARKWQIATVTATHRRVAACMRVRTTYGTLVGTPDHKVLTSYPKVHGAERGGAKNWLELSRLACGPQRAAHIMSVGPVWDASTEYEAGWLAGFMDGEGHVLGSKSERVRRAGQLGFSQNEGPVLDRACAAVDALGFQRLSKRKHRGSGVYRDRSTCHTVTIAGGFLATLRFLGVIRPTRLLADFQRVVDRVYSRLLLRSRVLEKEYLAGKREVVDITTTAGTFIAEGLVVHNCGPSGQMLNALLAKSGMSRADCHVTNAAACRGDTEVEKERAAACCSARLSNELASLDPAIPILALGAVSAKSMLSKGAISKTRGLVWRLPEIDPAKIRAAERSLERRRAAGLKKYAAAIDRAEQSLWRSQARAPLAGRVCIPSIHPAFILRGGEANMPMLRVDVDRAVRWALGGPLKLYDEGPFEVAHTVADLRRLLKTLRTDEIIIDVETLGPDALNDQMTMLGISEVPDGKIVTDDDVRVVLASPPRDTPKQRKASQRVLRDMGAVLNAFTKTHVVGGHNFVSFDMIVLARYGIKDFKSVFDTLIAHHAIASHLRQGLDHLGSMYVDVGPWKAAFKSKGAEEKGGVQSKWMSGEDLDRYNAADVRVNAIAWRRMQLDLTSERDVYEGDLQRASICREMTIVGYGFDPKLAGELSVQLRFRQRALLGKMRTLLGKPDFHPARPSDLRAALFGQLKIQPIKTTATGLASTASGTLEAVKSAETRAGRLAGLILRWRATAKTNSTFIQKITVGKDGRVHPSWKSFGTVSGRFSCARPNLMNLPRWSRELENRVRELYVAEEGYVLIYFDLSQSEMRMAAYLSGDEAFIQSCESGDVHTSNAKILFPDARDMLERDPKGKYCPRHAEEGDARGECNCGKPFRDVAKNAGFGILYQADSETIFKFLRSKGFEVTLMDVEAMFAQIHKVYARYYEFCEENMRYCKQHGHLREFFSRRIRWFGWYPSITDTSNYPVQGGIAALMNSRLSLIRPRLPRGARFVAQIHDACITEAKGSIKLVEKLGKDGKPLVDKTGKIITIPKPDGKIVEKTWEVIQDVWAQKIVTPTTGREWVMPIDAKLGKRWSDFG